MQSVCGKMHASFMVVEQAKPSGSRQQDFSTSSVPGSLMTESRLMHLESGDATTGVPRHAGRKPRSEAQA